MALQTKTKPPQPLYDPSKANPAYHLRYTWTGWPSQRKFTQTPVGLLDDTKPLWEKDGLRLLEHRWADDHVQLLFFYVGTFSEYAMAGIRQKVRAGLAQGSSSPMSELKGAGEGWERGRASPRISFTHERAPGGWAGDDCKGAWEE